MLVPSFSKELKDSIKYKSLGMGKGEGVVVCCQAITPNKVLTTCSTTVWDAGVGRLVHEKECQRREPTLFFGSP